MPGYGCEPSQGILQAFIRCICAYFMGVPQNQSAWVDIPLHTLMKLTPKAYGTVTDKYKAQVPAVSTWRSKGSTAKQHDSIIEGEALKLPGLETARSSTPLPELEIQGGFQTQRTDVILVSQRLMWHSEVESSCSAVTIFKPWR